MEGCGKAAEAQAHGIWTCARCWPSRRHFWGSARVGFRMVLRTTPSASIVIAGPAERGRMVRIWGCEEPWLR
jgi:hypothetical protein